MSALARSPVSVYAIPTIAGQAFNSTHSTPYIGACMQAVPSGLNGRSMQRQRVHSIITSPAAAGHPNRSRRHGTAPQNVLDRKGVQWVVNNGPYQNLDKHFHGPERF